MSKIHITNKLLVAICGSLVYKLLMLQWYMCREKMVSECL